MMKFRSFFGFNLDVHKFWPPAEQDLTEFIETWNNFWPPVEWSTSCDHSTQLLLSAKSAITYGFKFN